MPALDLDLVNSVTAVQLASLFGCVDDSWGNVLEGHRKMVDSCSDSVEALEEITKRLDTAHAMLEALIDAKDAEIDLPVLTEFCHLYLPAAYRVTPLDQFGAEDHLWSLLWLVADNPLMARYIQEHERGQPLLLDALAYFSVVLRSWTAALDRDQRWVDQFFGSLTCAVPTLILLILTTALDGPSPYPVAVMESATASTLLADLDDFRRTLGDQPVRLSAQAKEHVANLVRWADKLSKCLQMDLTCACSNYPGWCGAKQIQDRMPCFTCAGCPKSSRSSERELLLCSRCRAVKYCSAGHQKAHWKTHKLTCKEPIW